MNKKKDFKKEKYKKLEIIYGNSMKIKMLFKRLEKKINNQELRLQSL